MELGAFSISLAVKDLEASRSFYEKLGFRNVGIYRDQGLLDGRWVDTIIMEKLL